MNHDILYEVRSEECPTLEPGPRNPAECFLPASRTFAPAVILESGCPRGKQYNNVHLWLYERSDSF